MPLNRPSQDELLEAVAEFLSQKVEDPGADQFYRRVASNVINQVRREHTLSGKFKEQETALLRELLNADENTSLQQLNQQLNDAIANREQSINVQLTQCLLNIAKHKLAIDNPRYGEV